VATSTTGVPVRVASASQRPSGLKATALVLLLGRIVMSTVASIAITTPTPGGQLQRSHTQQHPGRPSKLPGDAQQTTDLAP
jgi:hypothetical protein